MRLRGRQARSGRRTATSSNAACIGTPFGLSATITAFDAPAISPDGRKSTDSFQRFRPMHSWHQCGREPWLSTEAGDGGWQNPRHERYAVRPPSPAFGVLGRRRHRPHRRCGGQGGGGRARRAGPDRQRQCLWRGALLPGCARARGSSRSSAATSGSPTMPSATTPTACCCWRRTARGYLNLCTLLTRAFLENQHRNRAELRLEWLEAEARCACATGLIALSGARHGEVGAHLMAGRPDAADAGRAAAGGAVSRPLLSRTAAHRRLARRGVHARDRWHWRSSSSCPVVATHPIQFLGPDDFRAHEARFCIAEGYTLADPRRPRRFTREQYFKTRAEMAAAVSPMCRRRWRMRWRSRAAAT